MIVTEKNMVMNKENAYTIKGNNSSALLDYESYLEHYKNINGFHFTS